MNKNFFLLFFIWLTNCHSDLDSSNMLNCSLQHQLSEFNQVQNLNKLQGRVIGSMIFSIYCPINIIILLFLLISTITKQQLRKSPGDICIGALICEIALLIHWFMMGIKNLTSDEPIINESFFCQFNSTLGILGYIGSILYNILFYIYLVYNLKYQAYSKKFESWVTHIIILIVTFALTFAFFLTKQSGKNSSGWCTFIEGTYAIYVSATLIGFILILSIFMILYSWWKAKKFIKYTKTKAYKKKGQHNSFDELRDSPGNVSLSIGANSLFEIDLSQMKTDFMKQTTRDDEDQQIMILRSVFFNYSNIFVLVCLSLWVLLQTFTILQLVNCWYLHSTNLLIIYTLTDILEVVYTTAIPLVRANEPKVKEIYRKSFKRYFGAQEVQDDFMEVLSLHIIKRKFQNSGQKFYIDFLSENERNKVLFRILAALVIHEKQNSSLIKVKCYQIKSSKSIFFERQIYILKDSNFRKYVNGIPKPFFNLQIPEDQIRFEAFMPIVFNHLQTNYKWSFEEELKISDNFSQLRESCLDEFSSKLIFFSKNDRILIRQISKYQAKVLFLVIESYQKYFVNNPDSFIQPLCGLYTFEVGINTIILYQGLLSSKIFIAVFPALGIYYSTRFYTLNGAQNNRNILNKNLNALNQGWLLQDDDFKDQENNQLHIQKEELEVIRKQLIADVNFLCSCGFTGYELIIMKIRKQDHGKVLNQRLLFKNLENQDEFYQLMIVGYLQTFNMRKKIQSFMKKIVNLNRHYETQVQNAQSYAQRFIQMISNITKV